MFKKGHSYSLPLGGQACAGFTIMELIVAVLIVSLIASTAIPKIIEYKNSFRKFNAKTYLIQDLKRAQAQSLTEGCRGIFTLDGDSGGYSFGCDYLDYDTSTPPSADSVTFTRELPENITISTSAQVIFNSRGQSVDTSDVISVVTIRLTDNSEGSSYIYSTGTLLGTGLFAFDYHG